VRARDRAIGIVLGVLLGLAIIIGFVFLGSEDTIDSPELSGGSTAPQEVTTPQRETTTPSLPAEPVPGTGP
jgi:hypothetical protein